MCSKTIRLFVIEEDSLHNLLSAHRHVILLSHLLVPSLCWRLSLIECASESPLSLNLAPMFHHGLMTTPASLQRILNRDTAWRPLHETVVIVGHIVTINHHVRLQGLEQ